MTGERLFKGKLEKFPTTTSRLSFSDWCRVVSLFFSNELTFLGGISTLSNECEKIWKITVQYSAFRDIPVRSVNRFSIIVTNGKGPILGLIKRIKPSSIWSLTYV